MAKESLTSKHDERQETDTKKEVLSNCFFELSCAKEYLKECDRNSAEIDGQILYLLIDISVRKISFYQDKYGFKVDEGDFFYVEDAADFFRKAEEFRLSRQQAT